MKIECLSVIEQVIGVFGNNKGKEKLIFAKSVEIIKMDILNNNNENVNKVMDLTLQINDGSFCKLRRCCN